MRLIDADELFLKLNEKTKELYKEEAFAEANGVSIAKTILSTHPERGEWIADALETFQRIGAIVNNPYADDYVEVAFSSIKDELAGWKARNNL